MFLHYGGGGGVLWVGAVLWVGMFYESDYGSEPCFMGRERSELEHFRDFPFTYSIFSLEKCIL